MTARPRMMCRYHLEFDSSLAILASFELSFVPSIVSMPDPRSPSSVLLAWRSSILKLLALLSPLMPKDRSNYDYSLARVEA